MSISNGLGPYLFCRKMEKMRSMREGIDASVFISRQSRHFTFVNDMIRMLFPISTSNWRVNNYLLLEIKTLIQSSKLLSFSFFRIMATIGIKRKLSAVSEDTQENARNGQSQNTFVPVMVEKYITQVS